MTLTKAKTILKHYGVTINSRPDGEYRVNVLGGTPEQAYFTNDIEDAMRTGLKMKCKCENNGDLCEACDTRETLYGDAKQNRIADATVITTLGKLNAMLKPEAQGWTVRRSPSGYYYMTHDEHAPSSGIYTFSCKGTTLGFWRSELADVVKQTEFKF